MASDGLFENQTNKGIINQVYSITNKSIPKSQKTLETSEQPIKVEPNETTFIEKSDIRANRSFTT